MQSVTPAQLLLDYLLQLSQSVLFWISVFAASAVTLCAAPPFMRRCGAATIASFSPGTGGSGGRMSWLSSAWGWTASRARELSSLAATGEPVKMTLVVRKDLKMGTGKIAAQCAHAAVAVVEQLLSNQASLAAAPSSSLLKNDDDAAGFSSARLWEQWYTAWHLSGSSKVALQCQDEETMMKLARHAKELQLPSYVIRDAGRTQIAAGSKTVLAVGPGPKSLVDAVTGHLKLL